MRTTIGLLSSALIALATPAAAQTQQEDMEFLTSLDEVASYLWDALPPSPSGVMHITAAGRDGGYLMAWVRTRPPAPRTNRGIEWDTRYNLARFDCTGRRMQPMREIAARNGAVVHYEVAAQPRWLVVGDGSPAAAMLAVLCREDED